MGLSLGAAPSCTARSRATTPSVRAIATSAKQAIASARPEPAPPALECLARWYGGNPLLREGQWGLSLADGGWLRLDDGVRKGLEERLASPDLEDVLSVPYTSNDSGGPVTERDRDPGRVRVERLLQENYGASRSEVSKQLVDVDFFGKSVQVHAKVEAALNRVVARLRVALAKAEPRRRVEIRRQLRDVSTFSWRPVARTDRISPHAFGIALDLNPSQSEYWLWSESRRWRSDMPAEIVGSFEAEGFIWGGAWYHYDTMHFEYRPELLPAAAAEPR